MRRLGLLLAFCALAACQNEAEEDSGPPDLSGFDPTRGAEQQAACEKRGGRWGKGGSSGGYLCFEDTRDAGKTCSRESDCESLCLARSRTCAPIKPLFGCNDVLTSSGARAALCID